MSHDLENDRRFWPDEAPGFPSRMLSGRQAWLLVAALGLIVFELTAEPALGILLGCLKFGWDELRLSRQLRRHDPDPVRGRVCARFFEAYALWRVSLVAFAAMFLVAFVHEAMIAPMRPAAAGPPREFLMAAGLVVGGFAVSALVSLVAVIAALRKRVRVWVGGRSNRLKPILLSVILFWGTPALLLAWLTIMFSADVLGMGNVYIALGSMFLIFFLVYPVSLLMFVGWLDSRIGARCPAECWPELWMSGQQRPGFLSLLNV